MHLNFYLSLFVVVSQHQCEYIYELSFYELFRKILGTNVNKINYTIRYKPIFDK